MLPMVQRITRLMLISQRPIPEQSTTIYSGNCAMKIYRPIERAAHWLALFVSAAAMIGVAVLISRPSEKSGNQPSFVGAEQQKKRLAIFLDGTLNSVDTNT